MDTQTVMKATELELKKTPKNVTVDPYNKLLWMFQSWHIFDSIK